MELNGFLAVEFCNDCWFCAKYFAADGKQQRMVGMFGLKQSFCWEGGMHRSNCGSSKQRLCGVCVCVCAHVSSFFGYPNLASPTRHSLPPFSKPFPSFPFLFLPFSLPPPSLFPSRSSFPTPSWKLTGQFKSMLASSQPALALSVFRNHWDFILKLTFEYLAEFWNICIESSEFRFFF